MRALFQELCVSFSPVKSTQERLHFHMNGQLIRHRCLKLIQGSDYLTALMSLVTPEVSQLSSLPASNLRSVFLVDAMAFVNRFQYLGGETFADSAT